MGASYYIEPGATEDLDVFVVLPTSPNGFISMEPIYRALVDLGGVVVGVHVRVGGWLIQILPAHDLVEEALNNARDTHFEDVPTRVLSPEYLCAICIQTGRPKDFLRVAMFLEQAETLDIQVLATILTRYGLLEKAKTSVPGWPKDTKWTT